MAGRTPEEIEREIEAERGALAKSLAELQTQFSPEAIVDTASGLLREHGGNLANGAIRQARQNPLAVAVTGAGLAWLIAGQSGKRPPTYDRWAFTHDPEVFRDALGTPDEPEPHEPQVAYDRRAHDKAPGLRHSDDPVAGFDERVARAAGDVHDPTLAERAGNAVRSARDGLRSAGDRLAGGRDDTEKPRSTASTRSLRDRLTEGTEMMTETARDRVIAAREAAIDAERRLEARARDYAATGRDAYGSQPLIGGLLAFGLGALIGAALPRTRQEDAYFGAYRDRAMSEAERIYREEAAKLRAVASAATDEAKSAATEALEQAKSATPSGQDAVDRAEEAATSAVGRVADAATSEARKRDVGGSLN